MIDSMKELMVRIGEQFFWALSHVAGRSLCKAAHRPLPVRAKATSIMRRRGFTIVEVLVCIAIVLVLLAMALPAVQRVRDASYRMSCQNRLKNIGLALQMYHDETGSLPPGCTYENGIARYRFISWCTRLLPSLGQDAMWQEAQAAYQRTPNFLRFPPHVGNRVQPLFLCPSDARESYVGPFVTVGYTHFLGVEGTNQLTRNGLLFADSKVKLTEIVDGCSNTLMVGERPASANGFFGWWYASDGQSNDGSAATVLGVREIPVDPFVSHCRLDSHRFRPGRIDNQCDMLHFWSLHGGGCHFLLADGAVRFLSYATDAILPSLATRAGGESDQLPD